MSEENAEKEKYQLSLKGPGITISKMVDSRTAGAIAQLTFGGHETDVPYVDRTGALGSGPLSSSGRHISLREYLQNASLDRGIHTKILAVGRYLRDFEGQTDFTREDVRNQFRSAGEPQPANFPRDFQKALRAAWIAEDRQNRGRFYVTRTGDQEIDRRQDHGLGLQPARSPRRIRLSTTSDNTEA